MQMFQYQIKWNANQNHQNQFGHWPAWHYTISQTIWLEYIIGIENDKYHKYNIIKQNAYFH